MLQAMTYDYVIVGAGSAGCVLADRLNANPTKRVLLQVRVGDNLEADQLFSVLMGDDVEPRRDFIVANALNARHLDV